MTSASRRFILDARDPFAEGWAPLLEDDVDPVAYSGTLAATLFGGHPHNWLPPGRAALDALCARVRPELEKAGRRLVFRPHARHVLSDVPSCLAFLKDHVDEPFGIALAPADMLEPSMLATIEDHLERFVEGLAETCACVLIADVVVKGDEISPVRPGDGVLPLDVLRGLLDARLPVGTPVIEAGG